MRPGVLQVMRLQRVGYNWATNNKYIKITKGNENIYPHKNLHTNVHNSIIPDSHKVETQMSIN